MILNVINCSKLFNQNVVSIRFESLKSVFYLNYLHMNLVTYLV